MKDVKVKEAKSGNTECARKLASASRNEEG